MTVAVVIGAQRARAAYLLERLAAQTIAGQLEVVVVDTCPHEIPLAAPRGLRLVSLTAPSRSFGAARAAAVRAAQGEIVAFLEDHCYPRDDWAEAIRDAHRDAPAAVGYAITNANPHSRVSRVVHLATYGEWHAPAAGPALALPGGNVSYRRSVLLGLGDGLPAMLEADFNLHNRMVDQRLTLLVEPRAQVEHESEEAAIAALSSSYVYSRMLAAMRSREGGWTFRTRVIVAAKDLLGAPAARLLRLFARLPPELRRELGVVRYLPGVLAIYFVSAIGEAVGYLAGEGSSGRRLMALEVDAPRDRRRWSRSPARR